MSAAPGAGLLRNWAICLCSGLLSLCLLAPAHAQSVSLRVSPEHIDPDREPVGEAAEKVRDKGESPGAITWLLDRTNTSVSGYFRNETAYRYVTPAAFSKVLNVARMETITPVGEIMEVTMVPRIAYDAVYDLEDVDTVHPRRGPSTILTEEQTTEILNQLNGENVRLVEVKRGEATIRELYLDVHFEDSDLRIGRQIVRWGVVEGARVTDEINPLDFKEFILREVQDRYVPLMMVKWDYYLDASSIQMLWIPEVKTHQPAPKGTEFEQFQFLPNLQVPDNGVQNAEYALKYTFTFKDADVSLSYFDTWDDFPAAFRSIIAGEFATDPEVDFTPKPPRLKILGATYTKAIGPAILSLEAAFVHNKEFGTFLGQTASSGAARGGEVNRNYVKWAMNVDFTFLSIDWSLQYLEADILGYSEEIILDQRDVVHAGFARRTFFNNLVTAQVLAIHFINDDEWVLRPRAELLLAENIKLTTGADIMIGNIADVGPRGEPLPGQFHFAGFFQNSSRMYMEIGYQF